MLPWSLPLRDSKPLAAGSSGLSCSSDQIRAADKNVSEIPASSSHETEAEMLQRAMPHFLQGLQAIPENEKEEYVHAICVAPQLVETESDPVAFLRFCDWDGPGAARRLCVYWHKRVEVFGKERAFLPLLNDFSGNGALGRDEIELLKLGAVSLMPADKYGRSVGHSDRSRAPPHLVQNLGAKLRASFLVLQQMVQNPVSQTEGVVWVIRGLQSYEVCNVLRPAMQLLREAFPLRVHAFHVAYVHQDKSNFFQRHIIGFLMKHFGRFFYNKTVVHDCVSVDQFLERMTIKHGVPQTSLPPYLGGLANTDGTATRAIVLSSPSSSSLLTTLNADDALEPGVAQRRQEPQQQATELKSRPTLEDALPIILANNKFPASSLDGGGDDTSLGGRSCSSFQMSRTESLVLERTLPNQRRPLTALEIGGQTAQTPEMMAISPSTTSDSLATLRAILTCEKKEYQLALNTNMDGTTSSATTATATACGNNDQIGSAADKNVSEIPTSSLPASSLDGGDGDTSLKGVIYSSSQMSCTDPLVLDPTPNHPHQPLPAPPALMVAKPLATIERTKEFVMDAVDYRDFHSRCDYADNDGSIGSQESLATTVGSFSSFEDAEEVCTPLDWMPIPLDCSNEAPFCNGTETDHFSEMADLGFLDIIFGPSSSNLLSPEQQRQQVTATAHAAVPPADGKLFGLEDVAFGGLG